MSEGKNGKKQEEMILAEIREQGARRGKEKKESR